MARPPSKGGHAAYNGRMALPLLQTLSNAATARLVLLANHVIASEPAAVGKLKPHAGRHIDLHFRLPTGAAAWATRLAEPLPRHVGLQITPAGLLEWTEPSIAADVAVTPPGGLSVTVDLPDPFQAVRLALKRERPPVTIEGDAALAEAVSWLMKNLRWDIEDDLARWLGVPPTQMLKTVAEGVKQALSRLRPGNPSDTFRGPGH